MKNGDQKITETWRGSSLCQRDVAYKRHPDASIHYGDRGKNQPGILATEESTRAVMR